MIEDWSTVQKKEKKIEDWSMELSMPDSSASDPGLVVCLKSWSSA